MRWTLRAAILYTLFFAFLFLQFPLTDSLSGNCDSWLLIALSNQYLLAFQKLFGAVAGGAMYPVAQIFSYGESSPGGCFLFLIFRAFGMNDLWASYAYLVLVFSLTALAVYRFAALFTAPFPGALFAGFAFTCCNMTFAHIDDSIIYFYFIPLTAARLLWEALERDSRNRLLAASALAGLQIYFSLYVFIYQFLLLAAVAFYLHRRHRRWPFTLGVTVGAGAIYAGLFLPFIAFYLWAAANLNIIDPFGHYYTAKMTALMPFDFVAALPENPLYGGLIHIPQNWGFVRHRNFIGILLTLLGLYGMAKWNRDRLLFILIAAAGFIFALGPNLMYHPQAAVQPPAPLYPFYAWIPVLSYLRVTNRAYFLVLLVLSLCAGLSLDRIAGRFLRARRTAAYAVIAAVFLIHGVENMPIPFKRWPVAAYITIPAEYAQFAANAPLDEVFLDLPTNFNMHFENPEDWRTADPRDFVTKRPDRPLLTVREVSMFTSSWNDLFQYNREIMYLYWQSQHRRSTVSGVNGYFPTPRMIYQYWTARLPEPEAFDRLKQYGVTAIAYHKNMGLPDDKMTITQFESSPRLERVFDGTTLVVFRLR